MHKIAVILEARTQSTRLKNKIFKKLGKYYVLEFLINRLKKGLKYDIIVATSLNKKDIKVQKFCEKKNIKFFRGKEEDLIHRVINCSEFFNVDIIISLTSDNPLVDPKMIKKMLDILNLELDFTSDDEIKVLLDNVDISTLIRSKEITSAVSEVSAIKAVREKMVKIQKDTAKNGNFIVEGRDIGTVVFPDAKYKFFLTADYDVRAQRRLEDFKRVNEELNVNKIKQDLTDRDQYDSSRKLSPLKQAKDAIVIDTSTCTIDDQVNQIFKHIERN